MDALPLAVAAELVYVAAAAAVLLLLLFQIRLAKKHDEVAGEVERLKRAHKAGTLDARSRLEEASKALEGLEETVRPRLESLEPHLADVGSRLDELEERVAQVVPTAEEAGRRTAEIEAGLGEARQQAEQAEETARGVAQRFGEMDEALRDARTRATQVEESLDHVRGSATDRIGELEKRLQDVLERLEGVDERLQGVAVDAIEESRREGVRAASAAAAAAPAGAAAAARGKAEPPSADDLELEDVTGETWEEPGDEAEDEDGRIHVSGEGATKASEPLTHYEGEFTYQGEDHEGGHPGMRGVLLLVLLLVALLVLLKLVGVGR